MQNLMVQKLNYILQKSNDTLSILKGIKYPFLFLLLSFSFSNTILAQDSTIFNIIKLENTSKLSVDRYNNIYTVNNRQDITKHEDKEHIYSSKKRKEITHIEALNSLKIFLFNREYQEFTLLDRYLTLISTTGFNTNEIGFISFATLAIDGNIWAIDNTDYSLKKIDIRSNKTITTTNLNFIITDLTSNENNEILFMKESSNFLYVCTKSNGILVFDNLGTYKKKLPFNAVTFLGFNDNELYFVKDKELIFFNLLSLETKKELLPFSGSKALIVDNKIYIVE